MPKQSMAQVPAAGVLLAGVLLLATGCSPESPDADKQKQVEQRKLQAEHARKEMEALPKTFRSRDPFRVNEPASPEGSGDTRKPSD
jgi:hypothetical protein